MESELLGQSPSLLERLSVQRVLACWLQLQYADVMACTASEQLSQAKFWSQHQDRAHRRYTSAVKQLATIRQLMPGSSGVVENKVADAASPQPRNVAEDEHQAGSRPEVDHNGSRDGLAAGGNGRAEEHPHGPLNGNVNGHSKPVPVANGDDAATSPPSSESGQPETGPEKGKPINRVLSFREGSALSPVAD